MKDLRNRHFDLIAFAYDRLLGPPQAAELAEMLRLPIRGRLLDAGGGTGRVSLPLRPQVGGVVVSDLSENMLRHARRKAGLNAVRARTEMLPFPDGAFERVIVVDAFHHFARREEALAELVRVLKPAGRILIEEPDLNLPVVKLVAVAEKLLLMESHFATPGAIATALQRQGLSPAIRRYGRFRSWIIADKP
ncbi:MAG: class I SAM-dependent methyltransferase [Proteobacteria bacterium]|nr:class I SAM-dependent methyltransferase [Pseudomonadota bacterium]